jgi:hypothetical protein
MLLHTSFAASFLSRIHDGFWIGTRLISSNIQQVWCVWARSWMSICLLFRKARSFDCTAWLSSVCVEYDGVLCLGVLKREDCVFVSCIHAVWCWFIAWSRRRLSCFIEILLWLLLSQLKQEFGCGLNEVSLSITLVAASLFQECVDGGYCQATRVVCSSF